MPVTPSFPGVYVQEVDAGSRAVTGVPTAITAFIGRTPMGPPNEPVAVYDYGEFQRLFGGRKRDFPLTYAVEDFFDNGGSQALIVRICAGAPLGTTSRLDLETDNARCALTTKLTGDISAHVYLTAAQSADPTKGRVYTLTFRLGSATSKLVLATLADVAPEAVDMALKKYPSPVNVTSSGDSLDPDAMKKLLDDLVATPGQFKGGTNPPLGQSATFLARANKHELRISANPAGAWADDLEFSVVKRGQPEAAADAVTDTFSLVVDHPTFVVPYRLDFTDWSDLSKLQAETGVLELNMAPSIAKDQIAAWVGAGVPLTRIGDCLGASASILILGPLVLTAASEGAWGNRIAVTLDKRNITDEVALRFDDYGIADATDFWYLNVYPSLGIGQTAATASPAERIGPVYLGKTDAPCRVDHVLATQSTFLRARPSVSEISEGDLEVVLDPNRVGVVGENGVRAGVLSGGSDGAVLSSNILIGREELSTGIFALDKADLFSIMVIPSDPMFNDDSEVKLVYQAAADYCIKRRAILIADPLEQWRAAANSNQLDGISGVDFDIPLPQKRSVFAYFPYMLKRDPEDGDREKPFSASGAIAGIFAKTESERGVWAVPGGIDHPLQGASGLEFGLSNMQSGALVELGINPLRQFPNTGAVIWGSRTLAGADALSDDYKYVSVRRLTDYIEESIYRGSKFAVFERNAEPLWADLRLGIGSFMAGLARQGAFYNYYVRCDRSTTTQFDIDRGIVNIVVAFAPVRPAEFMILSIQNASGQIPDRA